MVDVTYIDHAEEGLSLLPSQWENSPNLRGILEAWLTPLNTTEQCALDVRDGFNVNTAIGNQLDIIGAYFDESRNGRPDDEYRSAILSIISAANGSGTPDQLMELFAGISSATTVDYWEHYPLSIAMLSTEGDDVDINDPEHMQRATAGGIEYVGLMYDPNNYAWIGNEAYRELGELATNDGDNIITSDGDQIVVEAVFEDVDDGTLSSSFIDQTVDLEPIGYGENYGEGYGGREEDQSQFCEASFKDNDEAINGGNSYIDWAKTNELDENTGTANKRQPIPQYQDSGIKRGQPVPRMFFNWMMAQIDDWFNLFGQRSAIDTLRFSINPDMIITIDDVLDNTLYQVDIDANTYQYTSDADATLDEITAGLADAITNGAGSATGIDNGDGTVSINKTALYEDTVGVTGAMTLFGHYDYYCGGVWAYLGTKDWTNDNETTYVFQRES